MVWQKDPDFRSQKKYTMPERPGACSGRFPPADLFLALLHSLKQLTAHWVFCTVFDGTKTSEISDISQLKAAAACFRPLRPCALVLFPRAKG